MDIIDSKQCCELLGISEATLYRYIRSENMPFIQVKKRGKLLFRKAQVVKWIERYSQPYNKYLRTYQRRG